MSLDSFRLYTLFQQKIHELLGSANHVTKAAEWLAQTKMKTKAQLHFCLSGNFLLVFTLKLLPFIDFRLIFIKCI